MDNDTPDNEQQEWDGQERREGDDRRQGGDRRDEIRFELNKPDRRQQPGRREGEVDPWRKRS